MKLLSFIVLFLLLLPVAAQSLQNGIIDMDGQSFPPANEHEKAEWTFARFHYDLGDEFGSFRFERWAADYPKADRQLIPGIKRLTRIQVRSTEEVVDANSDDLFNWPWVYVEDPGAWQITRPQAARLREFFARGGFMMVDDSHGDYEWQNFLDGIKEVFSDRPIEDLQDNDELFHVVFDLTDRVQVPGTRYIWGSRRYTPDSAVPKFRAIRDDKGRIMVAICHNSDVGDAWEWADSPEYPERPAGFAYRLAVNYVIYGMTH